MTQSPKSRLERVFASSPLNSTAARVTSGGTNEDVFVAAVSYGDTQHFLVRPAMIPIEKIANPQARAKAIQLIGTRFGHFTVIGYAKDQSRSGKAKARWIARCVCGAYEHRTAKAISNPHNSADRCKTCREAAYAKREYDRLGSRPVDEFRRLADAERSDT